MSGLNVEVSGVTSVYPKKLSEAKRYGPVAHAFLIYRPGERNVIVHQWSALIEDKCTRHQVEYRALLSALHYLRKSDSEIEFDIYSSSSEAVKQLTGQHKVGKLREDFERARAASAGLSVSYFHKPRQRNRAFDLAEALLNSKGLIPETYANSPKRHAQLPSSLPVDAQDSLFRGEEHSSLLEPTTEAVPEPTPAVDPLYVVGREMTQILMDRTGRSATAVVAKALEMLDLVDRASRLSASVTFSSVDW